MCGIAGVAYRDKDRPVHRQTLERMSQRLLHRGPDDGGLWNAPGVGLAHRRLSIIDLSSAGHQPMSNEDGSVWMVFNGEIYNFRELRSGLIQRGHEFRSKTDAEVIVHLYEEEGEAFVERLHGMFAFALWDARARRLLLARDRVGKKPLKYACVGGDIVFASELKAILESGLVEPDVDRGALDLFMTFGYVPSPLTGFDQIRKLPPGHVLVWEDGGVETRRYWQLDFRRKVSMTVEDWKEELRQRVRKAVVQRLVSDVPLGAFLSGGIDSTVVVACMAEAMDRPVDTFSIGFDHDAHNELPYARQVAARYGTSHHEFVVRAEAASLLPTLASLYEEPYADPSALPSYLLSQETRRFVKVALNGDGGDEGFAGYRRYAQLSTWGPRLSWLGLPGLRQLTRIPHGLQNSVPTPLVRRLDAIHHISHPDLAVRYGWLMRLFSEREKAALCDDRLYPRPGETGRGGLLYELMERPESGTSPIDRMLFADTMSYLPDDLLVKMDLATMAHGLEARSPLLDHEVLELAASAPPDLKWRSGRLKWLLKEAFREQIPQGLIERRKHGFSLPLDEWFRGPLSTLAHELLLTESSRIRELLDPGAVRDLVRQHQSREVAHGRRLWGLVMLELWHREVVDRAVKHEPARRRHSAG